MKKLMVLMLAVGLCGGCSDASSGLESTRGPMGSTSVTQGGAQDIGHFRSIVEDGEVPRPSTIEPVGFFAEHAIDLPEADCGDRVCMHANLAVAPGIDRESNWTMAFVALNTPVDARALERPNTHIVLAIEDTTRTGLPTYYEQAFREFANELLAGDRISVVRFGEHAEVVLTGVGPTDPGLATASRAFTGTDERAALYDGLARASALIEGIEDFDGAHRIVLLTSGRADAGVTDQMRVLGLSDALAAQGVGVSVIGTGTGYRPELAMQISEGGGGSYYFAENISDLENILTLEGRTSLFPLATNFELRIEAAPGYQVGRVYGARRAWSEQSAAYLTSPVLMVGNRTGADDIDEGRRGGGGGLFVELIVDPELASDIGPGAPAFTARAEWIDAESGEPIVQSIVMDNALAPGANPGGMFPHFADPLRGKAFMMLNMYLSLRTTVELFHGGDCAQALGIPPAMLPTYEGWQAEYDDPDVDADWALLTELSANVRAQCSDIAPVAPEAPMSCFHD